MGQDQPRVDLAVVGAGFGGLGTALRAVELGLSVSLHEALSYPGGCAGTFTRGGRRYEAGATLPGGLAAGQLFHRFISEHDLPVVVDPLDPVITYRAPGVTLDVPAERSLFAAALASATGAPRDRVERLIELQARVADTLWTLLDEPSRLPPFGGGALIAHARAIPRYLRLMRYAGRPLRAVLDDLGLSECVPLVTYLDAACQITVQCGVDDAEAPVALGALDYPFRGAGHVRGGIGALAEALLTGVRRGGAHVRMADRITRVDRESGGFVVHGRKGVVRARRVALNVVPHVARRLLGLTESESGPLDDAARDIEAGWGACMLYLTVRPPAEADGPHHYQLVDRAGAPLHSGNHVFLSISGPHDGDRAPAGLRTATVSTHVPPAVVGLDGAAAGEAIAAIHANMRRTLSRRAPEWWSGVTDEMTASPRTFARFTGRHRGFVGGVPRRVGWHNYTQLGPQEPVPGVHLVGDSTFPGQSALATALGGVKAAEAAARALPARVA